MQNPTQVTRSNRLTCKIEKNNTDLFFSLINYRNNLFISNDVKDIMEFYNGFENREQLIEWMKERPKGANYIHEADGDKSVIVVIPTADFNGEYARNCRDNIFKGLHMVFVESGGIGDFYFNYAHNCNVGIKKAMEYNPKWVVVSNDDMHKIEDISILTKELSNLNADIVETVATEPTIYHSIPAVLSKQRFSRVLLFSITRTGRSRLRLEKKFHISFFIHLDQRFMRFFFQEGYRHISITSFGIFSREFCYKKNGKIYDETYINAVEDWDVSLEVSLLNQTKSAKVNYKIGDLIGKSLGTNEARMYRNFAGYTLLNYKISENLHSITKTEFITKAL